MMFFSKDTFRASHFLGLTILILFWLMPLGFAQEHMGKGRIAGEVMDVNGEPIEDALIVVESLQYEARLEGRSNEKGHFAVTGMGTGMWRITASKPGYTSPSIDMNVRQLRPNPPITFRMQKLTGSVTATSSQESLELFDRGNQLLIEGQYDEALKVFEEFQGKYPEIYQVHLNIGSCFLKKGEVDKAEEEFKFVLDKTLQVHGDYMTDRAVSFRAFSGLGETYLKKEDFDTAQKYFSQALEISPEDEVAAYNVAEVFFSHQKIEEAIRYFELAVKIKEDWPKPYLKLGYVYLNKGDFTKSIENFNTFVRMDPENPEVPQVKNIIAAIEKMKK